jgi:hypothetical protein
MDYRQLAYQTAQKYGIDPDLFVRQIQAESAFRPDAVSSAGAIGLGQLMPATAKELGVDPTDPVQNLEGAARYMKQQLDRFGDPALALAAYNAGPSRVAKANGVPNITETQNYVAKILGGKGGAAMAQEPQQPQGLLGGLLGGQGIGERLGLSPEFSDKLAMAVMAGTGDARLQPLIAQRAASMKERKEERKLQKGINKTIDYFQKKADAGDDLAATMVGALNTQQIDPASAISTYISESTRAVKDTRTAAEKEYDRAAAEGYQGSFMDFLQAKKKEFNIGINTEGADDFTKALMKGMATRYETYQSEADAAEKAMANLNLMGNLVSQDDFYSGPFGNQVTAVRRVATLFGADPQQVADAETFNKIAKDSALQVMGGSLGVGFSNADRDFVEAMVPNIENTKAGNLKIIEVQAKIQNRKIELARMAEQYAAENGTLKGFRAFITEWRQQNPLFSAAEKAALDPAATAKSTGLSEDAMSFIK